MSATSGTAEEVLSLPKGGGAIQNLGATFETDLNTGTGSYTIPITVPGGPNGVQPRLNLRYHSAAGNGPFGLGWTLGVMTVARKNEGRIPSYGPDDDLFVLVGVEDLVPLGGGAYRPRVDTMHWRIRRLGEAWELTDTHGTRHLLGQTGQARVETIENGLTKTAQWLLEELQDSNGNAIRYHYRQEGPQRYLESVEWGTYRLEFTYAPRPDRFTSGRFGFLLSTELRCERIELHVQGLAPSLARSWTLEYAQSPDSRLSLLQRVTLRGHGADGSTAQAPPVTLSYTELQPRYLERLTSEAASALPGSFDSGQIELLDWDGNGLPDLLQLNETGARLWLNLGHGRWDRPRRLPFLPTPLSLDEPGVAFADMEGNGTADLISLERSLTGYYPLHPGGGFERPHFWRQAPSPTLSEGRARLMDLNGDGVIDLLATSDRFLSMYLRDPSDGWNSRPQLLLRGAAPPVSFDDPHVYLADMNGDGLIDLARVDGSRVTYWPYLGNGRWGDAQRLENAPKLPRNHDPGRLHLTDIDGDGCADLVYIAYDRVYYWLNRSGAGLSERKEISYTPPAVKGRYRLVDLKGSGTRGVLWSSIGGASPRRGYLYLDLSGGGKPYLLTQIDNGMGLETRIRYQPSTEFALQDAADGEPWQTFHPFPMQCVSEMEHYDRVTGQASLTRYHYHNGRYDPQGRTFLGFNMVDVESVGDGAIPTLLSRNVYHLGLDPANLDRRLTDEERLRLGALRRRLLRTELYARDGSPQQSQPFEIISHEYTVETAAAADGGLVLIPYETRTLEEQWERGPAPVSFREVTYSGIDAHGNIPHQRLRIWRQGEPAPDQDVITQTVFAQTPPGAQAHVTSLPARITQRDAAGNVISDVINYYDGPAHVGLPEGQVTQGNLTRKETLILPDAVAQAVYGAAQPDWQALNYHRRPGEAGWWIHEVSYERQSGANGLKLITRGPRGFDAQLEFDSSQQFPARLTDPLGHVYTATPDRRAFQIAVLRDPNQHEIVDRFDPLGRVIATIKPGDSDALPTTTFVYRSDVTPVRSLSSQRVAHGQPATVDEYQYFGGRGQFLQRIGTGDGGSGREFVVHESQQYTTRGQIHTAVLPYYTSDSEYSPSSAAQPSLLTFYDALGRVVSQEKASGQKVTRTYLPGRVEMRDEAANAGVSTAARIHWIDGLKRPITVQHQLSNHNVEAQYEYDALGHVQRVRHPGGGETRLVSDLLGRVLLEESVDTGRSVFVYDANGNQVERRTAGGKVIQSQYDALDRLIRVQEQGNPSPEIVYEYLNASDPAPPDGEHNRRGRLWRLTDRIGSLTYRYDALGRVVQTRRTVAAMNDRAFLVDVQWNAIGFQTQVTLPEPVPGSGRRVVACEYNPRGLPIRAPNYVKAADYDAVGRLTRLVYQNDVESRLEYHPQTGRPQRLQVTGPGGASLRDQSFHFDLAGNLTRMDADRPMEAGTFTYDGLYRLTGADYDDGAHFGYAYADDGNLTHIDGLGDLLYTGAVGSAAVTDAGGQNYTYTPDGHLQTAPYGALQFDAFDNLRRINLTNGSQIENDYNFQGQRAVKRKDGALTWVQVDRSLEYHHGLPTQWISFGGLRILAITNGASLFLHTDMLGTPTLFTDVNGNEVRRLAFSPYGELRFDSAAGGSGELIRFSGQPMDVETGLLCLGRRYYDPRLGRFISADRAVPGLFSLDGWNRYLYAHNNPLRFSDPSGRFSVGDFFAILGIAVVVAALIVAGVFTGGSTWVLAGVMINVSAVLFGTAVGVAAGAIIGGIAAYNAGGDIWKGVLFGGFVGGVAAFGAGVLAPLAGAGASSLGAVFGADVAGYIGAGVSGAVQGAIIGAGSGAAIGFAGGQGTAAGMWSMIWRGMVIGAITGALLNIGIHYLSNNPILHIGTLDKINPQTAASGGAGARVDYLDSCASLGQGATRAATGLGGAGGAGTFFSFGANPSSLALYNLNLSVPISYAASFLANYGGMVAVTNLVISLDGFTDFNFGEVLVLLLEVAPYVGVILTAFDDADWDWFEDMKSGFQEATSIPQPA